MMTIVDFEQVNISRVLYTERWFTGVFRTMSHIYDGASLLK